MVEIMIYNGLDNSGKLVEGFRNLFHELQFPKL